MSSKKKQSYILTHVSDWKRDQATLDHVWLFDDYDEMVEYGCQYFVYADMELVARIEKRYIVVSYYNVTSNSRTSSDKFLL